MRVTLHWLAWKPTPYNDFLFQTIAADSRFDLKVYYRNPSTSAHPWATPLGTGYSNQIYNDAKPPAFVDLSLLHRIANSPGVVLTAGWPGVTAKLLIAWLSLRNKPLLFWTDTPKISRVVRTNGNAKVIECFESNRPYPQWHRLLRRSLYSLVFRSASTVFGTGIVGTDALHALGCPHSRLVGLPFFVPLPPKVESLIDTSYQESNPTTFVTCGQLVRRKGYDKIISALSSLKDSHPNFLLKIIGDGPERAALARHAADSGIGNRTDFLGWLEPDRIQGIYSRPAIFVHPAISDAYPVAVLEAMASGLPILGSDASGSVVDRVKHGESGFVHRAGDIPELSSHCASLIGNPTLCRKMGMNSRRVACEWPVSRGVELIYAAVRNALGNS